MFGAGCVVDCLKMEAVVAVLRPKHGSVVLSNELLLASYDILLVEMRALSDRDKGVQTVKQLPSTNILLDDEPSEALSSFLYRFTGGENGGIRGTNFVVHCTCIVYLSFSTVFRVMYFNTHSWAAPGYLLCGVSMGATPRA